MFSWIVQIATISFVLIFLVHHLVEFFKTMLTVPKVKDLVNTPTQHYRDMYAIIHQQQSPTATGLSAITPPSTEEYSLIDLLPIKEAPTMKNELKHFLKSQLHGSQESPQMNVDATPLTYSAY